MKVTEIFTSIQGEGSRAGLPCTFVRFTTCDLRCSYCDTEYAFYGGQRMEPTHILTEVNRRGVELVCVTGGEPMLQKGIEDFMSALVEQGNRVLLETGGHRPLTHVPAEVVRIVDLKTPGAAVRGAGPEVVGTPAHARYAWHPSILDSLRPHDEIKVVVTSRSDFDWALGILRDKGLFNRVAHVLFSPSHGDVNPAELAEWLLESGAPGRLNLQLHKVIWGAEARGV